MAFGPDSAGFSVPGPNRVELFRAQERKMGPWPAWARNGSKSTLKKKHNRKSQANIFKNSGCNVCLGRPAQLGGKGCVTFCLRARQYRTFCAWAEQYRTSSRSGSRKWALGQFGSETAQSQYFYKGFLTGSHRPTFSGILGVLSVLDGQPSLGTKGT